MALLRSELHDLRTRFDDSLNSHENTSKSLTEQVRELNQQREQAQQEVRSFKILVTTLVLFSDSECIVQGQQQSLVNVMILILTDFNREI